MSTGHLRHRRRYLVVVLLVTLLVSVSAVSLAGASATTTPSIDAASTATTAPTSIGAPDSAIPADRESVLKSDTNPATTNTTNTSAAGGDTETYLLVLDDNLTVGPTRTAADVERAKHRAERAQAPVVDRLEAKEIPVTAQFWITNAIVTTVDPDTVTPANLKAIDGVTRVESNIEFQRPDPRPGDDAALTGETTATTDGIGATTYGLEQINVDGFVDAYNTNGSNTRVAILDDGLNESHPDINVTLGVNVSDGTVSDPATTTLQSDTGHGDHVAGTAIGTTTPVGDVARYSVAPDAALLKADVFVGGATLTDILAAIQWAVEEDADVVSMSLGLSASETDSTIILTMDDAIQNANSAGTVVIGSAGNDGSGSTGGPVNSPGTEFPSVSIGATDATGDVASFSSGARITPDTAVVLEDGSGTPAPYPDHYPHTYVKPDVTAPGVSVMSAGPLGTIQQTDPTYSTASGTSMAAPHVAGAVALLQSSTTTHREPDVLINALAETARKPDGTSATTRDIRYGMGIIDVLAARDALNSTTTINGTVTGDGSTLTGAAITTDSGVITATNGGTYTIEPTTDAAMVAVTANEYGYVPETTSVTTGGSETVDFELDGIESIRVELDAAQIETTSTTNLTVVADHTDGTESDITEEATVTSSNTSVATINETAINGEGAGTTTITAHYDGFTGETPLEVRDREGIELSVGGHQNTVSIGDQETVGYTIDAIFDDGSTESVTDSATLGFAPDQNETVLTIDTDATTITGTEPAENVTLIADDGIFEDTIDITVTDSELETIALELSDSTVTTGGNVTATVTGTYADGSERTITDNATITASDTDIAVIDNTTVTGISSGTTTITATVDNETATADLTVVDPAFFDMNVTQSPSSVIEGEPLTLEYTVTNTGERTGTQNITVSVNGTEHTSEPLQLKPNTTITDTVTYQTQSGDAPSLEVEITSENATISKTVAVQTPPHFVVEIDSINNTVLEGDGITAAYTVTNTGDVGGTQSVSLRTNGTIQKTTTATLASGATNSSTFHYQTQSGDVPALNISITSENTTAAELVTVDAPAAFTVAIDENASSMTVTKSDPIVIVAEIKNIGTFSGSESITYTLARDENRTTTNITNVTVPGRATTTVNFTTETSGLELGEHLATVESETDTDTRTITVEPERTAGESTASGGGGQPSLSSEKRDNFTIRSSSQSTTTIRQGESFSVSADIQNMGDQGAQQIQFLLDGTQTATKSVLLRPRETTTITFNDIEVDKPAGEYTYQVVTEDDTVQGTITVSADEEPVTVTPDTEMDENDTAENSTTPDSQSGSGLSETAERIPGFGVSVAVLSLLLVSGLLRRRSQQP